MREKMKNRNSYQAFASVGARLILYVALPALLLALQAFALLYMRRSLLEVCAGLYGAAAVFLDFWIFGGTCARGTKAFEYLKTSVKGCKLMRKALMWDAFCHFCSMAALVALGALLEWRLLQAGGIIAAGWTARLLTVLFLDYAVWILAASAARHCTMMVWYYVISVCGMGIFLWLAVAAVRLIVAGNVWLPVPLAVASLLLAPFSVKHVMRRMEESYHDKTVETGNETD